MMRLERFRSMWERVCLVVNLVCMHVTAVDLRDSTALYDKESA